MPFTSVYTSVPLQSIRLTDQFWLSRQHTVRDVSLPHMWRQMESTGRLENFRRAAQGGGTHASRYCFDDSDLYKWLEACAYVLRLGPDKQLMGMVDEAIKLIAAAQQPDGYLDTFIQLSHPDLRFRNLISMHEMYCAGHLIEAAVAFHDCLGDDRLLLHAAKFADLLAATFGPGQRAGYCGHEEIELALLRLASSTGIGAYEELAIRFVALRGSRPSPFERELDDAEAMVLSPYARRMHTKDGAYNGEYCQDHSPVQAHTEVVGHAVRAMYLYIAATQIAATQHDEGMSRAMERVWNNLTGRRMYVTGGIGPSGENEGFTSDFDLPNSTAYAETCAACGLVFWGQKLAQASGDADYIGVVERALYNGALSGISISGDRFFYANPLESRGNHRRVPWFECACCPPNIARLIGSVESYAVGISGDAFWLNIPVALKAFVQFKGIDTELTIESDYPWSGRVTVSVSPAKPVEFELRVRIPDWCEEVQAELPGLDRAATYAGGYAVYRKRWLDGDRLSLEFGMQPQWVAADPRVRDDLGRIALTRGPLVYCAESVDNGFAPQLFSADPHAEVIAEPSGEFRGVTQLTVTGARQDDEAAPELYIAAAETTTKPAELVMIPYALWANRGQCDMQVWLRHE
ncbi:MAG: glycoside hydrolase family 127 protein [Fimbriimonadaceae bacterium]